MLSATDWWNGCRSQPRGKITAVQGHCNGFTSHSFLIETVQVLITMDRSKWWFTPLGYDVSTPTRGFADSFTPLYEIKRKDRLAWGKWKMNKKYSRKYFYLNGHYDSIFNTANLKLKKLKCTLNNHYNFYLIIIFV